MDTTAIIAELKSLLSKYILAGDINIDADTVLQDAGIDSFSIVEIILSSNATWRGYRRWQTGASKTSAPSPPLANTVQALKP